MTTTTVTGRARKPGATVGTRRVLLSKGSVVVARCRRRRCCAGVMRLSVVHTARAISPITMPTATVTTGGAGGGGSGGGGGGGGGVGSAGTTGVVGVCTSAGGGTSTSGTTPGTTVGAAAAG